MLNLKFNETHAVINTEGRDGYESYYLEKGNSNRMYLALRSEIRTETNWALSRLLHISKDFPTDFSIKGLDGLVESLLEFPLDTSKLLLNTEDSYSIKDSLHQASDAVTILFNLSLNDANAHIIHQHQRLILGLCQRYLRISQQTDIANEITLNLLNILDSIADIMSEIPKNPLLGMIANLVYTKDRAFILVAIKLLSTFANKNTPVKRFEDVAQSVFPQIVECCLVPDAYLRAASLEFIYATASRIPEILRLLMTYKELPILIKTFAYMLYNETTEEFRMQTFKEGTTTQFARPQPEFLNEEDRERIGQMNEPTRAIEIKTLFEEKEGAEFEQNRVHPIYEQTFRSFEIPLQKGDELVKLFPQIFRSAKNITRNDGNYWIKNVKLKTSVSPFTCLWGDDNTVFDSADALFNYIVNTYIDVPEPPVTFSWAGELFSTDSTSNIPAKVQLKAKLLTLMPLSLYERENDAIVTVEKGTEIEDLKNPTKRAVIKSLPGAGVLYTQLHVPHDQQGFPRGIAYQAALLIRLLAQKSNPFAKNVQQTDEANRPESKGYFGLPIPTNFEEQQNQSQTNDQEYIETYPEVTKLLSLFTRRPLADVGLRSVSLLSDVCLEAFEFIQDDSFGSLIVETV
ncbi:hypothetical protein E3Q24_00170 [Wallemia mellicola]|uniref:FPL domain-containing protein n=1 Tax=Wallemia mellicola TaxID=1708541 RepID=A0AB74KK00_9BASI|nr:hypothetical protein E3Q24_00170 [Wallemia mellicola]TIC26816.1 hypothetical protein E3Q12_00123 [Wallemia mellicola]TIC71937.1 hypothetical protein E3Q03_00120 [Wallemia mellicola]